MHVRNELTDNCICIWYIIIYAFGKKVLAYKKYWSW